MTTTRKPAAKKATKKAATKSTPKAAKPRPDVYQIVTDALLAKLETGTIAWRKPWHEMGAPRNYVSGRFYSGINSFLLNMTGCLPFFLTFKQAKELGGSIREGAKSYPVIFFKMLTKKEGAATPAGQPADDKKIPMLQYYRVFSVEDVVGVKIKLPEVVARPAHEPVAACEQVLANWADKPKISHMQQRAYYSPVLDYVNMPKPESFHSAPEYYATLFHELGHSTGHPRRLNREGITEAIKFGSENYAREELVAEMSAAFLCAFTGIAPQVIDNSAAYLVSWLGKLNPDQKNAVKDSDAYRAFWVEKLKEDKKLVVQAATRAKQAAEYILGTSPEESPADAAEAQEPAQEVPAASSQEPTAAAPAVAEVEAPRDEVAAEFEARPG
jgi:antirestriction protein ArdC